MGYYFTRFLMNLIVRLTTRLEVEGKDLLPDSDPYVVVGNHLGRLDAVYVYYSLNRRDIIMLVAEKYRKIPLIPWFVKQVDAIYVDRFNADLGAMRETLRRLKGGWVLTLAPEGTRSKSGKMQQAHAGASYLAAKAGVPIFPAAITGSEDKNVVAHMRRLKRTPVLIRIGQPFTLPPIPAKDRDAALQSYTDEIMCRIAALLPVEYRGVYADHPRLHELLEG